MSALIPSKDEHNEAKSINYTMEEGEEESRQLVEKKRRLSYEQVKALERNFDVDNKLDPERKLRLAQELELLPRQVAVWFQNRRARWKTRELERDYCVLKANFDALKDNYEKLHHENEALLKEIQDLKSKMKQETENECKIVVKAAEEIAAVCGGGSDSDNNSNSNSSGSPTAAIYSSTNDNTQNHHFYYGPHFVKIEEYDFLSEDSCTTFFSDDQPPTLHWDWNNN